MSKILLYELINEQVSPAALMNSQHIVHIAVKSLMNSVTCTITRE